MKTERPQALVLLALALLVVLLVPATAGAQETDPEAAAREAVDQAGQLAPESEEVDIGAPTKIILVLTGLALLPSVLMTVTSFTRIIIVLSFVRKALSIQDMPPNQIIIGMSLFLSIAVMHPVLDSIYDGAIRPYMDDEISLSAAADVAHDEMHAFLLKHAKDEEIELFIDVTRAERPETPEDVPIAVLIPAFTLSELKVAFKMGFLIYIPFLIVDIVVASLLLSMGMMMLPPVIISTPFKILLFIMVDGWALVIGSLMESFQVPL
ncbi:MAG: flagellar type III secretion system pore protein FliP [Planctomycetes bacterium]|nr:flagellar type III secretion system pore protein FliP [Planctomycetota bacterium]